MSSPAQTQGPQPADQVMQLATGYMVSSALHAIAKLGIADLLKNGPKSTRDLASASATNEDALYRVMRALASVGVFSETSPRTFALTPIGELIRSDREDSFRDMVLWLGDAFHFKTYPEMLHSIKTGETVPEKVFGLSCFDCFAKDKELSQVFNAAMTAFSRALVPRVLEVYDFSWLNGKTLVDLGGGHGLLLSTILKSYPGMNGIIFDLDHVVAGANARIHESGLAGRCETCSGDFFASVPTGDAYIMKHIIHDWNDERALAILKNCRRAAKDKARVILIEAVLTPGNEPHMAKWLDVEMLLLAGGRERTQEEFAHLLHQAGFRLTRVLPTKSPVCVLEAELQT
ncbi:MAG: methyltransferase [Candidatus Acidiferrum sp.]